MKTLLIVFAVLGLLFLGFLYYTRNALPLLPTDGGEEAPEGWQMATDATSGAAWWYPTELPTTYIRTFDWPPHIEVTNEPFVCTEAPEEAKQKIISGRGYCVTTLTEGAAGSVYSQYTYATEKEGRTLYLRFTLQAVQCGNYSEPETTECESERASFDLDALVDRMMQTVTFSR